MNVHGEALHSSTASPAPFSPISSCPAAFPPPAQFSRPSPSPMLLLLRVLFPPTLLVLLRQENVKGEPLHQRETRPFPSLPPTVVCQRRRNAKAATCSRLSWVPRLTQRTGASWSWMRPSRPWMTDGCSCHCIRNQWHICPSHGRCSGKSPDMNCDKQQRQIRVLSLLWQLRTERCLESSPDVSRQDRCCIDNSQGQ